MVGLLLPLVVAAALAVVAVSAAGREPAPGRPSRPPVATGPRPPRRGRLIGAGIAAAAVVGLAALAGQGPPHVGGDPGGRILADLRPAAAAVPAGARVLSREEREPTWTLCDGPGGSGWTDVGLSVNFEVVLPGGQLIAAVGRQLTGRGWRLEQSSDTAATWSRPLATGHEALAVLTAGGSGAWWLRLTAPPQGLRHGEGC